MRLRSVLKEFGDSGISLFILQGHPSLGVLILPNKKARAINDHPYDRFVRKPYRRGCIARPRCLHKPFIQWNTHFQTIVCFLNIYHY